MPASLSIVNSLEAASFRLRDESGRILLQTEPDYATENGQFPMRRTLSPDTPFANWTIEVTMNPAVVRPLLPYGGKGGPGSAWHLSDLWS